MCLTPNNGAAGSVTPASSPRAERAAGRWRSTLYDTTASLRDGGDLGERGRFLFALGRFGDPQLAERALGYVVSGPLRPQELRTTAMAMATDEAGRERVFGWVRASWSALAQRLPPDRVPSMTRYAGGCSPERLRRATVLRRAERRTPAIVASWRAAPTSAECVALRQRAGRGGGVLSARAVTDFGET